MRDKRVSKDGVSLRELRIFTHGVHMVQQENEIQNGKFELTENP